MKLPFCRITFVVHVIIVWLFGLASAEKAYPLGCSGRDPSFYDYERYPFPPKDPLILKVAAATEISGLPLLRTQDDFLIYKRLGIGKFSDVFEAVDLKWSTKSREDSPPNQSSIVVLKCLKPVSERKIRREVLVLHHASRLPNLARMLGVVLPKNPLHQSSGRADDSETTVVRQHPRMPTLILAHAGKGSQWFCHNSRTSRSTAKSTGFDTDGRDGDDFGILSQHEVRYFLFHLLIALDSLHACGIMHRDVKPRNVLIHRKEKRLMLIDLGLADFYLPHQRYNVRVASRHYKSPELLLGYEWYDYAIDMWGVGCILAGLLFHREPLFRGRDNLDQLGKIISRLGTTDLINYAIRYNMQLSSDVQSLISQYHDKGNVHRRPWLDLFTSSRMQPSSTGNVNPMEQLDNFLLQGIDLVDRLLVYDHDERWTARQAMQHRFFDGVRDDVLRQVQTTAASSRS